MKNILSSSKIDYIKRSRQTYPGCFVRVEGGTCWTYNDCVLVCKKETSEGLFFVITAANEKILLQKGDMFVYGDTKETMYMESPTESVYYGVEG